MTLLLRFILLFFFGLNGCAAHSVRPSGAEDITLSLHIPQARNVEFLSSLDGYTPHPASKNLLGSWQITLPSDRSFTYFYLVDSSFYLPGCENKEYDDFGAQNCLYIH